MGLGELVPVERERVMWEKITGLGVRMRVYIRQGCDSLAQCEGLGVDVWVLGVHEGEEGTGAVRRRCMCGKGGRVQGIYESMRE